MILAVAPEGTRSPKLPWKTGFLAIAHQAKAHIILISFDYERKRIVFGPVFLSQGNFDDDMQKVYRFFSTITAKYPKNVVFPKDI
jgi:1-acyl-sn-glycerol-3-phosphate acyltransferase